MFEADYGPLFAIWIAYFFLVILATNILMARALIETSPERRAGLGILMLATLTILITGLLYVLSARDDPTLDILSIGFGLTALIVSWVTALGLREPGDHPFREAIGGMDDAVIILDSTMQVVYANKPGERSWTRTRITSGKGWPPGGSRCLLVPTGGRRPW